ncbi:CinA family protein [Nakamurella antarctica]|uniref:CinA family protein n=1 Tax=Nakamurella antarctica TaxID=1902245 RepID=A0A3G8ZVA8_9ACTN|nr:CinA family protein [Nakamurella antarctica]AZI57946.1 CinA family protein [Nakamurella antarctica]
MNTLSTYVGLEDHKVAELLRALASKSLTVSVAESLTGGLMLAVLTEIPGASAVIRGGLVVYATDLKHQLAGVDSHLLDRVGAVDADVALALAAGTRRRCQSSIGIGLTGVAGPDPQDGKAVGTVFVALSMAADCDGSVQPREGHYSRVLELAADGTRADIRAAAVRSAIQLLAGLTQSQPA